MDICLDHTIVHARDPVATAEFVAGILGVEPAQWLSHFLVLKVGQTSLDYMSDDSPISSRHFAFRVGEADFDAIFDRIQSAGIAYWADPFRQQQGEINHWDDGRGLYFADPDGHLLEVITRPYGSGGCEAEHPNPLLNCDSR